MGTLELKSVVELNSINDLDAVLQRSMDVPVLIFKHSATCGTSNFAFEEFESYLNAQPGGIDTAMVIVQSARPVSNAIAERLGLHHQSPQAIIVRNGKVLWHKSHYSITASAIQNAVLTHQG